MFELVVMMGGLNDNKAAKREREQEELDIEGARQRAQRLSELEKYDTDEFSAMRQHWFAIKPETGPIAQAIRRFYALPKARRRELLYKHGLPTNCRCCYDPDKDQGLMQWPDPSWTGLHLPGM